MSFIPVHGLPLKPFSVDGDLSDLNLTVFRLD